MKLIGRTIYGGHAVGEVLVSTMGISFFGGIDPDTGIIVERGHELEGQCIAGKIFVFPTGKGSTVGSYTLYRLKKAGKSPLAIINTACEPITAVGCIISGIPCVDQIPISKVITGMRVTVDGEQGSVVIHTPSADPPSQGETSGSSSTFSRKRGHKVSCPYRSIQKGNPASGLP